MLNLDLSANFLSGLSHFDFNHHRWQSPLSLSRSFTTLSLPSFGGTLSQRKMFCLAGLCSLGSAVRHYWSITAQPSREVHNSDFVCFSGQPLSRCPQAWPSARRSWLPWLEPSCGWWLTTGPSLETSTATSSRTTSSSGRPEKREKSKRLREEQSEKNVTKKKFHSEPSNTIKQKRCNPALLTFVKKITTAQSFNQKTTTFSCREKATKF